ncbi:hypothetical protein VPHD529_0004 [Vibrio phage D529]
MALTKLTKPRARWATFKLKLASAISRSLYDKLTERHVSLKDFGAVGDGVANDQSAFSAARDFCKTFGVELYIPTGDYLMQVFNTNGLRITGDGSQLSRIYLEIKDSSTQVSVQISTGTNLKDIGFFSKNVDVAWQRATIEGSVDTPTSDITIEECHFEGFTDSNTYNAWGLYMKNVRRIDILRCSFKNNSQSDIAIVDNCEEVRIISPWHVDGLLNINSEPNGSDGNFRVTIEGCKCDKLQILVNSNTVNPLAQFIINNVHTREFIYDGGYCAFNGFTYETITTPLSVYGGYTSYSNSFAIGANLVPDPRMTSMSNNTTTTSARWSLQSSANVTPQRAKDPLSKYGRGVRLNPDNVNGYVAYRSDNIDVVAGTDYLFACTGNMYDTHAISSHLAKTFKVRWYDTSDTLLQTNEIKFFHNYADGGGQVKTTTPSTETAILEAPATATYCYIIVGTTDSWSTVALDLYSTTMHEVFKDGSVNYIDEIIARDHALSFDNVTIESLTDPTVAPYTYLLPMQVGDTIKFGNNVYVLYDDTYSVSEGHWQGRWVKLNP